MPRSRTGLIPALAALAVLAPTLAPTLAMGQPQATDVRPGDDFYAYANGDWLRATTLPEGRASYDTTAALRDATAVRVRALIQAAARGPDSPQARRVGDYYAAWMDTDAIEAKRLKPLSADLDAIRAIRDRATLSAYLGRTLRLDDGTNSQTGGLLGVWIHQGFHNGGRYAAHLLQGGLGVDRDDYADPARADAYRTDVAATLRLAGFDQADARAARVLALETALAAAHAPASHASEVSNTDNPWRRRDFDARAPGLDWTAFFQAAGLDGQDEIIVWQPSAVIGAARLADTQSLEAWRDYLAFHLIRRTSGALPKAFRDGSDRTEQALAATNTALGQDVGQLYVARYFPPQAKAAATAMAETIRKAFAARIATLTWMAPATRDAALAKLAALRIGVGYPDAWIDYSGLAVRRDDAYGNLRRAEAFAYRRELAKLRAPVDPGEWSLLPQQPGAIINFSPNALQFSAGILQAPYFDPAGDAAANYGSAGAGMAHEISHSFDELGAVYDDQGRLARWWSPDDAKRYQAASAPLAARFARDCPKPDLCLNGQQVLGEGVGDLAGLRIAYDAYVLSLGGKPDVIKDGLTGDQRFFLSFARRWRRLQTDAALVRQIATDSHAPGAYRAATVRHHEAWIRAFDVRPGDRLYLAPADRATIW